MASTVVIGCADQQVAYGLRSQLSETVDAEVLGVAETTVELTELVLAHEPHLVLVHDRLGPEPVLQVVRDLGLRRPASVSVVVTDAAEVDTAAPAAMTAGARGVLGYPFTFAELQQAVTAALEWSQHLRSLLAGAAAAAGPSRQRGRATVVAVAGGKGGVGVTTLATHLAWDLRTEQPAVKVLVVDLDLEKGDVSSLIEARYRTSIADVAKVYEDLSQRAVADAVFEHTSGVHLLLPPDDVREVEWVSPAAVRQVIALTRQMYDLVLVDVGARVTPVQAAVVELADEVLAVVTPDLVALRGLRRSLGWWESLAVRKPETVRVVLNRHHRADEIQPATVARLSPAPLLGTVLPDLGRRLEAATNSRSPDLVTEVGWWRTLRALTAEAGLVRPSAAAQAEAQATHGAPAAAAPQAVPASGALTAAAVAPAPQAAAPGGQGGMPGAVLAPPAMAPPEALPGAHAVPEAGLTRMRRRSRRDDGSASVELVGVLGAVLVLCVLLWQVAVAGLTFVWTGHAAADAARSVALGRPESTVVEQAREVFPPAWRDSVQVAVAGSAVDVRAEVPLGFPGVIDSPWQVTVSREVVREP